MNEETRKPQTTILERVGRAIAAADQEDYMEDWAIYDRRAAAAILAYEQAKAMEAESDVA